MLEELLSFLENKKKVLAVMDEKESGECGWWGGWLTNKISSRENSKRKP